VIDDVHVSIVGGSQPFWAGRSTSYACRSSQSAVNVADVPHGAKVTVIDVPSFDRSQPVTLVVGSMSLIVTSRCPLVELRVVASRELSRSHIAWKRRRPTDSISTVTTSGDCSTLTILPMLRA